MLENTTVTLPLQDFDKLRNGHDAHKRLAWLLSVCFKYDCSPSPQPQECEKCEKNLTTEKWNVDNAECRECETYYNYPDYTETLTVDVARLIKTAKEYSLYGKNTDADIDALVVTEIRE